MAPEGTRGTAAAVLAGIWIVLAFVLVQVTAFTVVGDVDVADGIDAAGAMQLLAVQLIGIAGAALVVVLGAARSRDALRRLALRGAPAGSLRAGWRLLLPVGLLVIGPSLALALASGDDLVHEDVTIVGALALIALAIAIAVNEELWFRGLLVDQLERARRPWLTVFGGALLFGLPHVAATSASWLNAAAVTLAVAIPFTIVRLHVGSLWPLIGWHALIDVWAFLHTSTVVAQGEPSPVEAAVALVVPALVAAGYVAWWRGRGLRRLPLTP